MKIVQAFDNDINKIGKSINDINISSLDTLPEYIKEHEIHVGIITVPERSAQGICDILVSSGILAIWNFAPTKLNVPPNVIVQNENMASSLAVLSRHLNEKRNLD